MSGCRNCNASLPPATGTRQRVWCSDRCRKAAGRRGPSMADGGEVEPLPSGSVAEALEVFLDEVEYPPADPRSVIATVARLLAAELDRAPSVSVARELRGHVGWLSESPNSDPGAVDEIRARRAARRVELMLTDTA